VGVNLSFLLKDYHIFSNTSKVVKHPIESYVSYSRLSPHFKKVICSLNSNKEPTTYEEAACINEWCVAMNEEIQALERNGTWTVLDLPPNKSTMGCKWVYKVKFRVDGTVERHKARLVAKGYTQMEGLYFLDTFSPVAKLTTIRLLLSLAAINRWYLK